MNDILNEIFVERHNVKVYNERLLILFQRKLNDYNKFFNKFVNELIRIDNKYKEEINIIKQSLGEKS